MTPTEALATALHTAIQHWSGLCPAIDGDRATRILAALPAGWALVDMARIGALEAALRDVLPFLETMWPDENYPTQRLRDAARAALAPQEPGQ